MKTDQPNPTGHPRRILIIDDYPNLADGLAKWLRRFGNEVEIGLDGSQAIAIAEKFRPEVMLLDIGLPDIDGYEVAKSIRQRPWSSDMILIAITGHRNKEERDRIRTSGFNAHLVKPLVYKQLASLLATYSVSTQSAG